jgi:hypothetical protein
VPRTLYAVFAPVENENNVTVIEQANSASITWETVVDASNYTLVIYRDANRTDSVAVFQLDANGNVVAQNRSAQQTLSCNVPNLSPDTKYFYSLTSYDADNYAIEIYAGNFTTISSNSSMEDIVENQLSIYPNPAKSEIFIKSDLNMEKIEIFDLSGRKLLSHTVANVPINISALPQGLYMVKIHTSEGTAMKKIGKK